MPVIKVLSRITVQDEEGAEAYQNVADDMEQAIRRLHETLTGMIEDKAWDMKRIDITIVEGEVQVVPGNQAREMLDSGDERIHVLEFIRKKDVH